MIRHPLALLTPVPYEHLEDGQEVCRQEGRVAFGSQAWQLFRELDRSGSAGIPVLIYASHSGQNAGPTVTWDATYVAYVESVGGIHPEGTRLRPPSTQRSGEDGARFWAGFYEVADLRELEVSERIQVSDLRDRKGKRYGRGFVPEGPIVVSAP